MLALRCGGRVLAGAAQQQRGALLHVTRRVAPAAAAWGAQLSSKVGLQGSLPVPTPIVVLRPFQLLETTQIFA